MTTDIETTLLPEEASALAHYEEVIRRGLQTTLEVGEAFHLIKRDRLYRAEFATFDDYCLTRWDIKPRRAHQVAAGASVAANLAVAAAEVVSNLAGSAAQMCTIVHILPQNEAQVRPLTSLPAEAQVEAWESAVRASGGGQPTAKVVSQAAQSVTQAVRGFLPEAAPDEAPEPDAPDEGAWRDQMEAALRSVQGGGIYAAEAGMQCIAGCRVRLNESGNESGAGWDGHGGWEHDAGCDLGIALAWLDLR